jgi:hypothetical protein
MINQIYLLQHILSHKDQLLWASYTYNQLLYDISLLHYYIHSNAITEIVSIKKLDIKHQYIVLLYGLFFNKDVCLYSSNAYMLNNDEIETILYTELEGIDKQNIQSQLQESFTSPEKLSGIYIGVQGKNQTSVNWEDILVFIDDARTRYTHYIQEKKYIYIENMSHIYFIYFILYPILTCKPITFIPTEDTFTITDYNTNISNSTILITTKYANTIQVQYDHSIFYNYTINQFLIHSTKIKKNYMLGSLYPFIIVNDNTIRYKKLLLSLPESYVLKKNILFIRKKKSSKQLRKIVQPSQSSQSSQSLQSSQSSQSSQPFVYEDTITSEQKYMCNNANNNMMIIGISGIEDLLSEKICNNMFTYILKKHPYTSTTISTLQNICLYNHTEQHTKESLLFTNKSYFSMNFVVDTSQIIIIYTQYIHPYIENIILELNHILTRDSIQHLFIQEYVDKVYSIQSLVDNTLKISAMNVKTLLQLFGFGRIQAFTIYYYKLKNAIWNINDIDTIISYSKKINNNKKSIPLGYHYFMVLELDIGISIIIERTTQLQFYIKEERLEYYRQKNIKIHTLQHYSDINSSMDTSKSVVDVFTHLHADNSIFNVFVAYTNNCAHLVLNIAKYLLHQDKNNYILLENKLKNNIDIQHITKCVDNIYIHTSQPWNVCPNIIKNTIIQVYSTKYSDTEKLTKDILQTITQQSLQKRHIVDHMKKTNVLAPLLLHNFIQEKHNVIMSLRTILYIKKHIQYILYYIGCILQVCSKKNNNTDSLLDASKPQQRLQIQYIFTETEMKHIYTISKKLQITSSEVLRLFILKICIVYFPHYYFIIGKNNYRYILPYVHDDKELSTLHKKIQLFTKNNYFQHLMYDISMRRLYAKGYYLYPDETYISIQDIHCIHPLHNIDIHKIYSTTTSKHNPIDITYIYKKNKYEIFISYDSKYTIVQRMIKEMFIIMELYALQKSV